MNKQFLRNKKEYQDLKNFWLDTDIINLPLDPEEYPCVVVYDYVSVEERPLLYDIYSRKQIVNYEFVYSKDFFPTQN